MNGEAADFLPVGDDRVVVLGRYVGHPGTVALRYPRRSPTSSPFGAIGSRCCSRSPTPHSGDSSGRAKVISRRPQRRLGRDHGGGGRGGR